MLSSVHFLRSHPAIRFFTCFAAGTIVQYYCAFSLSSLSIVTAISFIVSTFVSFFSVRSSYQLRWLFGIFTAILIASTGAVITHLHLAKNFSLKKHEAILLELKEPLIVKPNSFKAEAMVMATKSKDWKYAKENIILYFEKDSSLVSQLTIGTRFIAPDRLELIKNSGNPGGFDYASYCKRQGIHRQAFLRSEEIQIQHHVEKFNFNNWISCVRQKVLTIIQKNISNKQSAAIAEALLIGYKIDLDKDIVQAYSNTGVIHIIAISGLHLALIYGLLLRIVSLIPYLKNSFLKWLTVLSFLWLFSILTGASPSVLRSAVMFSFIILGKLLGKDPVPLNNLAGSAVFLLMYNPLFLWDAGFQLSYAAVAGIMIFYKKLSSSFFIENKILDHFWKLNAVTLSAQVFTIPLVIYHFHQFPNMFLFTNLVAVPLSGLVLYAELLLMIFNFSDPISVIIGRCIGFMIETLNRFILYMNNFKFAVTENISWTLWMTICITVMILCASRFIFQAKKGYLFVSIFFLTLFIFLNAAENIRTRRTRKLIVYNAGKTSAAEIIAGRKAYYFGDNNLLKQKSSFAFNIRPTHTLFRVDQTRLVRCAVKAGNRTVARGSRLPSVTPDIFIISGNPKADEIIFNPNTHSIIVADNTNARWKINRWKKQADSLHLRFHSIPDQGAFVMDL